MLYESDDYTLKRIQKLREEKERPGFIWLEDPLKITTMLTENQTTNHLMVDKYSIDEL